MMLTATTSKSKADNPCLTLSSPLFSLPSLISVSVRYVANSFNFYVCPRPRGSVDVRFSFQVKQYNKHRYYVTGCFVNHTGLKY